MIATRPRQAVGAALLDLPRIVPRLLTRGGWVGVANRGERRQPGDGLQGVRISGGWSSTIHACDVYPGIGQWLMKRALRQWPIALGSESRADAPARIAFVIPFRGREREPLLRLVVESILAQRGVGVECIVVEQSNRAEALRLPEGVRYVHLPHPSEPEAWHKSWALNAGVAAAAPDVVVCHDADILIPEGYAAEVVRHFDGGDSDVAHLHRFLFYMTDDQTRRVIAERRVRPVPPACVRQDWQGGTLAIRKSAFERIGGFDERFVGWTGEDREFFDRCLLLKRVNAGYLPFVHLSHPPQPSKSGPEREAHLAFFQKIMEVPREARVARLRAISGGASRQSQGGPA